MNLQTNYNMFAALDRLKIDMQGNQFEPPDLVADGGIHRFKQTGDKGLPCWYMVFEHPNMLIAVYGCWKRAITIKWSSVSEDSLSEAERREFREAVKKAQNLQEEERKAYWGEVSIECQNKWAQSVPVINHPYMSNKKVEPIGMRQDGDYLLVPLYDERNVLMSLQSISRDGGKCFYAGGKKSGCFFPIGQLTNRIFICEGVATGLSVHQASNCYTIVAFDSGNLKPVAEVVKKLHPQAEIIIAADNDHQNESNVGLEKAKEAADAVNAVYVLPQFDDGSRGTDFNDLMIESGLEAVKLQLDPSKSNQLACLSLHELITREFPPREHILSPWLPTKGLAMLYAPRGVGKTFFALSIAIAVSLGKSVFGWKINKPKGVLYIDGEMPIEVLQERVCLITANDLVDAPLGFITRDLNADKPLDITSKTTQRMIEAHLDGVELIIIDNISTLCSGKENESESWIPMQEFALRMRASGRSVLFVHHAGKSGAQRGTSKREDVLDTVISLKRPSDYDPKDGAVFELHFEKSRGFCGKDAEPKLFKLVADEVECRWEVAELEESTCQKVIELKNEGLSPTEIAGELQVNKSTVSRYLKRARQEGLLHSCNP